MMPAPRMVMYGGSEVDILRLTLVLYWVEWWTYTDVRLHSGYQAGDM